MYLIQYIQIIRIRIYNIFINIQIFLSHLAVYISLRYTCSTRLEYAVLEEKSWAADLLVKEHS